MLFVASPNNPTGGALKRTEVQELCTLDALVVVDEAYIEFGGESSVGLLDDFPNLVVLRTFSKWAALAGLRVGYAICREELAAAMMSIKQPYNVNAAADVAARAALAHRDEIFEQVRCIVSERNRISSEVGALGWLRPYPSVANFVLFQVGGVAERLQQQLRDRGVLVRHYSTPLLSSATVTVA